MLSIFLLLLPSEALSSPADIEYLESVYEGGSSTEKATLLLEQSLKIVDEISRSRDYPRWFNKDNPLIVKELESLISRELGGNPSTEKLYQVSVKALSGYFAEEAMSRAALGPSIPISKQSVSQPLSQSAQVTNSGSQLKIDVQQSLIQGDKGFMGAGNGILEKGESATVALFFKNTSGKRLYSTSLYVTDIGDCLFTPKSTSGEILLPELEAGKAARLDISVYASKDCRNADYSIRLKAYDSHYFASTPQSFTVSFRPKAIGGSAELYRVRVEADDYGHSEPVDLKTIMPDSLIELSAGLETRLSKIEELSQTFHTPSFMSAKYVVLPQSVRYTNGVGRALPVDDVDLKVESAAALQNSLIKPAVHFAWKEPADAKIFIAVDSYLRRANGLSGLTTTQTKIDKSAVNTALEKYTKVDVVTSKSPSDKLTEVDGLKVKATDFEALLTALEGAKKDVPVTAASAPRTYIFRHYIELPIYWEPEVVQPVCRISSSSTNVLVGQAITLSGSINNAPDDAEVRVLRDGDLLETYRMADLFPDDLGVNGFSKSVTLNDAGTVRFSMQLSIGNETVCNTPSRLVTVRTPTKEKEKVVQKRYPKLVSVELGPGFGLPETLGGVHGQVHASVGKMARFQAGLNYTGQIEIGNVAGSELIPMIGTRFTQVLNQKTSNPNFYLELSESVGLSRYSGRLTTLHTGVDSLDSWMISPSVMLSAHTLVGGYVELTPVNRLAGVNVGPSARIGLGVYF